MEQPNKFNIQSHLDSLRADSKQKEEKLLTERKWQTQVMQTIEILEALQKTYNTKQWELVDLACQEHKMIEKIKCAQENSRLFNLVRQDPSFANVSDTPAEYIIKQYIVKMERIQTSITNIVGEISQIEDELEINASLSEKIKEHEETCIVIATLEEELESLTQEIYALENIVSCLCQQNDLDGELKRYGDYIRQYWKANSKEWIHQYLHSSGKNQNVPFTSVQIYDMIDFLDGHMPRVPYYTQDYSYEKEADTFDTNLREHFGENPALIVAFAHTLHLQKYPEGFFDLNTGFGVKVHEDGKSSYEGCDPLLTQYVLIHSVDGVEIPQMVRDTHIYNLEQNFHFSFHTPEEEELQTTKQLMSPRRFLKDFWRYQNFYEFDIDSKINVYKNSVTREQQKEAIAKYKQKRLDDGTYLWKIH